MIENVFVELSIIIAITFLVAGIMRLLKQPLIIGYIVAGIVIGPSLLNLVHSTDAIATFAPMGVALLLFMVGLNLNPNTIKDLGKVSLITGVGQVILTATIGFAIGKMLGFSTIVSLYVGVAITFSSTIIVMKLLSDKGDIETLYGRISVGFLIVQDLIAISILMFIPSISNGFNLNNFIFDILLKGFGSLILLFLFGIYILPKITKSIAKSQEFLLLFSISWCFALAALFYSLNFSMEIGALLAGFTLSISPYRYEIMSRTKSLRDFFIVLFFILLGSQIIFTDISQYIIPIIIFSAFVLIGNPLIVMILMGWLGYTKKTSFLTGIGMAQVSEFSLIIIDLGVRAGHLTNEILSFVTIIGLITIAGSSYLILYANKIYPYLAKYLSVFEKKNKKIDEKKHFKKQKYDIILFGYDRIGLDLLECFKRTKKKFMVIDYNPEVITNLQKQGFDCRYGDASDSELLDEFDFSKTKMFVSTIPDYDTNILLINKIKEYNKKPIIIVVAHQINKAMHMYDKGATYVLMPHFLGGYHTSLMIEKYGFNLDKFLKEKAVHIENLKKRKKIGQEHPRHEKY